MFVGYGQYQKRRMIWSILLTKATPYTLYPPKGSICAYMYMNKSLYVRICIWITLYISIGVYEHIYEYRLYMNTGSIWIQALPIHLSIWLTFPQMDFIHPQKIHPHTSTKKIHAHTSTHPHTYTKKPKNTSTYIHKKYIHIYPQKKYMHIHPYIHIRMWMYGCMKKHIYTYISTYMYI